MAVKYFCDCCGDEMTSTGGGIDIRAKIHGKGKHIASVFVQVEEVKSNTHVCDGCVIDAVNGADTRPKPAEPSVKYLVPPIKARDLELSEADYNSSERPVFRAGWNAALKAATKVIEGQK